MASRQDIWNRHYASRRHGIAIAGTMRRDAFNHTISRSAIEKR